MKPWLLIYTDYDNSWVEASFNTYSEAVNHYEKDKGCIPSYYKCNIFHSFANLVSHVKDEEE